LNNQYQKEYAIIKVQK